MLERDELWVGPAPADEECAQVGQPDFEQRNLAECRAYIQAIKKTLGDPPDGVAFRIGVQGHDSGVYREVVISFDPTCEAAVEWAYRAEDHAPTTWAAAGMFPPEVGRIVRRFR